MPAGGGTLAGDEPRIAGVNAPLYANTPTPARKETSGKSAANRGNLRHARGSAQEHLTPEERARLEWMREQKTPRTGASAAVQGGNDSSCDYSA